MKLSIIISVLNSHLVVKRQIRHFRRLRLQDDVEIIFMDDGSDPPLLFPDMGLRNFNIYPTYDKRLWTQGLARNKAAEIAKGEFLLMTDIDHIIPRTTIDAARCFTGDRMNFFRFMAILSHHGEIVQDIKTLLIWGMHPRMIRKSLCGGVHTNTFLIRKSIFWELGGYNLRRSNAQVHTMGEDKHFNKKWLTAQRAGKYKGQVTGPSIFTYPLGKFHVTGETNPHNLFHNQPRNDLGET